jgi:hypothetical protein
MQRFFTNELCGVICMALGNLKRCVCAKSKSAKNRLIRVKHPGALLGQTKTEVSSLS